LVNEGFFIYFLLFAWAKGWVEHQYNSSDFLVGWISNSKNSVEEFFYLRNPSAFVPVMLSFGESTCFEDSFKSLS
jgi:hypothetical protein